MSDARYNLRLQADVYNEVGEIAKRHGTNRLNILLSFIKWGLRVERIQDDPDEHLMIKRGDEELTEIQIVF